MTDALKAMGNSDPWKVMMADTRDKDTWFIGFSFIVIITSIIIGGGGGGGGEATTIEN